MGEGFGLEARHYCHGPVPVVLGSTLYETMYTSKGYSVAAVSEDNTVFPINAMEVGVAAGIINSWAECILIKIMYA